MSDRPDNTAIFPGTFDPITYGHLDIIDRGRRMFSKVIVGVGINPEKKNLFSPEERVEMIKPLVADMINVSVQAYSGLTADFALNVGARFILRGVRDIVDLRNELQQANTNMIVGDIETVFILTAHEHALTSSTLIKQIVELGGKDRTRLTRIVPESVLRQLQERLH
ncbi:MAG: pantetheine-phosphate adenylyltransferase [Phycisphaerae bacterium]|nr:pantetheine-phosphate adenylyltransferase [Phycisphaerae bacterium]